MGDGIMAVFQRARDAVAAAARSSALPPATNARKERHQLQLRVGIMRQAARRWSDAGRSGLVALAQRLTHEAGRRRDSTSRRFARRWPAAKFSALPIGHGNSAVFGTILIFSLNWRDDPILRVSSVMIPSSYTNFGI